MLCDIVNNHLKIVILQDAVDLTHLHPKHYSWDLPVFKTAEFSNFQMELNDALKPTSDPIDLRFDF
jgi:hypothetical protein